MSDLPEVGIKVFVGDGLVASMAAADAERLINEWLATTKWATRDGLPPDSRVMQLERTPEGRWECTVAVFNFYRV